MSATFVESLGHIDNKRVIKKYIDYVENYYKLKSITNIKVDESTIVDEFCKVISKKTKMPKPITAKSINQLAEKMNEAARIGPGRINTGGWGSSQRDWALKQIAELTGNSAIGSMITGKAARSFMTPEGQSLVDATLHSTAKQPDGIYLGKNFDDLQTKPVEPFSSLLVAQINSMTSIPAPTNGVRTVNITFDQQKAHSQTLAKGSFTIANVERKLCGKCWMCGFGIYVYKFTDGTGNNKFSAPCGQDEHVLPPGWGNLIGILWSNKTDHLKYNVNTNYSLAPSHIWCNQLKNAELLLSVPTKHTNYLFTHNVYGSQRFKNKGLKWLSNGTNNMLSHDMAPHIFYQKNNASVLMDHMEQTMQSYMDILINNLNTVNPNPTKPSNTHYDVFMLRTIMCIVHMYTQLLGILGIKAGGARTKDILVGFVSNIGKSVVQPENNYIFSGINIKTDLLASCIYDSNDTRTFKYSKNSNFNYSENGLNYSENKRTAVRTILDSCQKFDIIEEQMICYFDTYPYIDSPTDVADAQLLPGEKWEAMRSRLIRYTDDPENADDILRNNITNTLPHLISAMTFAAYLAPEPPEAEDEAPYGETSDGLIQSVRANVSRVFSPT
jgi:hypothetical protein